MKKTVDKIPFYRLGWNKKYYLPLVKQMTFPKMLW
jgi:hypothetical protein